MEVLEDQELKCQPEPLVVKVRTSSWPHWPLRPMLKENLGGCSWDPGGVPTP